MVKGAASQVLQVPPLKSGVYLGYSVCFDVYVEQVLTFECLQYAALGITRQTTLHRYLHDVGTGKKVDHYTYVN